VWVLFLVPILAIFFLRDGGSFHEVLLALVQSRSQREFLQDVLQDLNQMLAQFIRAQLTLAALSFMAYSSMLGVMRVPYALMLGTAGGALEFLPLAGPLLAGVAMMTSPFCRVSALAFCSCFCSSGEWYWITQFLPASWERKWNCIRCGAIRNSRRGEIAGILGVYLSIR